jgi:hypothetical protein
MPSEDNTGVPAAREIHRGLRGFPWFPRPDRSVDDYLKGMAGKDVVRGGSGHDRCEGEVTKWCEAPA